MKPLTSRGLGAERKVFFEKQVSYDADFPCLRSPPVLITAFPLRQVFDEASRPWLELNIRKAAYGTL